MRRRAMAVAAVAVLAVTPLLGTSDAQARTSPLGGSDRHVSARRTPPVVHATPKPSTTVPHRALPAHSGSGRRIVYSELTPQHVWLVDADGSIVADYAASGRADWPRPGTYHVFSQSRYSSATGVTFGWMTRFAHGRHASIGFHTIPRYAGSHRLTHPVSALGLPVGHGGCVHLIDAAAEFLYGWAHVGTTVVVLR